MNIFWHHFNIPFKIKKKKLCVSFKAKGEKYIIRTRHKVINNRFTYSVNSPSKFRILEMKPDYILPPSMEGILNLSFHLQFQEIFVGELIHDLCKFYVDMEHVGPHYFKDFCTNLTYLINIGIAPIKLDEFWSNLKTN